MIEPTRPEFARSLLFNIVYTLVTIGMMVVGLPVLLSPAYTRRYVRLWARLTLHLLRVICGTGYEVRGQTNITSQPVIYASQHQSAWDIFALLALLPSPLFVLKRELLWIPMVGWFMSRFGVIAINRSRGASAIRHMTESAREALYSRRPLVIYPEGTRKEPGAKPVFLPGVAALYGQLMVPVVPVVLNSGLFWGRNAFYKKPGKIVIQFLPALPPGLPPREMVDALKGDIQSHSAKLLAETAHA